MTRKASPVASLSASRRYVLGRAGFAKISAVEGVVVPPAMEAQFRAFEKQGLTAAERRRALGEKYGRARSR